MDINKFNNLKNEYYIIYNSKDINNVLFYIIIK